MIDPLQGRKWLHNSGMSVLLLLLVVTVFVMPAVIPFGTTRRLMADILMSLILVSGVVAVAEHRKSAIALAVLSLAVILLAWTEWIVPAGTLPALRELCALAAFLLLAFAVGINVFASGHAIGDRVFGAIVLYLLQLVWPRSPAAQTTFQGGAPVTSSPTVTNTATPTATLRPGRRPHLPVPRA